MESIYRLIGRWALRAVWLRYQREIRIALGVGIAAALLGGYLAATREPPEG